MPRTGLAGSGIRARLTGCNISSTLVGRFVSVLGAYRFTHCTPTRTSSTVSGLCRRAISTVNGVRGAVGGWHSRSRCGCRGSHVLSTNSVHCLENVYSENSSWENKDYLCREEL